MMMKHEQLNRRLEKIRFFLGNNFLKLNLYPKDENHEVQGET